MNEPTATATATTAPSTVPTIATTITTTIRIGAAATATIDTDANEEVAVYRDRWS